MEERRFKSCILDTAGKIQVLRISCSLCQVPEPVQDGYEEIIDKLISLLGATQKQRELFWSISDPE